jgi:hypothetical protein
VGDYTRSLVRELTASGHCCLPISLNESESTAGGEIPTSDETVLRLAGSVPWRRRIERAGQALRDFAPDWVSLQFVGYGFHPKGLVFGLAKRLAPLCVLGRCHIMFHELWIGESTDYGLKDRVVGFLQKWGARRLLRTLRPSLIHTSNPTYVEVLRRNGVVARELPLFGSLPLVACDREWFETTMRSRGVGLDRFPWHTFLFAGVFGTIHWQWSTRPWFEELCSWARSCGKRLVLLQIGHTPKSGQAVWDQVCADYAGQCEFVALGVQSSECISTIFQMLDFGIATSPWALIGKSSTVAAMLDHGLPVLVTRDDWKLRRGPTPDPTPHPLLFRFGESFLQRIAEPPSHRPAELRLPAVAAHFLQNLYSRDRETATARLAEAHNCIGLHRPPENPP